MPTRTVADLIAVTLAEAIVEPIWRATGDSLNGWKMRLRKLGKIQRILTGHEKAAAFAVGPEASRGLTSKSSVCPSSFRPRDIPLSNAPSAEKHAFPVPNPPCVLPGVEDLDRLVEFLSAGEAITLLCGSGCAGALDEIVTLADRLGAPLVYALRGKEHVEWDNPFDLGMTGLVGFSSGYHAMENCHTLLMLGSDFPYRAFYPANARIIQIDRDPTQFGTLAPLALGIVCGIGETIAAILPRLESRKSRKFLTAARAHCQDPCIGLCGPSSPAKPGSRSILNMSRGLSASWPTRIRSSPPTWARSQSGPRAT
jgi:thiamine pyrophosphate-dependent acetolactate synthase large subunit-like protein